MKRYIGNTGRIEYIEDKREAQAGTQPPLMAEALSGREDIRAPSLPLGLELSDLALLLMFFFLYQESGDEEFLILLACFAFCLLNNR